ncbi:hypothetical protein ACFP2T_30810 [Plantactinospora solaniradicis]|uniref:PH domain-containing protein n=1 Tax=Plantactinospora solaniradicis TaxID=1723736 RepID=A0ABW1KG59_9ACTN
MTGIGLLWLVASVLAQVLVFDDPWYDGLVQLPVIVLVMVAVYLRAWREAGLPLRLTRDHLVLTRPDGEPLAIGWDNLAVARVTGVASPTLVVEPGDPERTDPVLDRWQWGRLGQRRFSREQRPYEIKISLTGLRPGAQRLRTELAARLGPERSARS